MASKGGGSSAGTYGGAGYPTWGRSSISQIARSLLPYAALAQGASSYFPQGQAPSGGGGFNTGSVYRIQNNQMPSWGGWAWGAPPADRVVNAGFDWFEYGYPDRWNDSAVRTLAAGGVRPFAYINLAEAHPSLFSQIGWNSSMGIPGLYSEYGARNQPMADLTNRQWQDWLVRRAGQAYAQGARGIKWDVAEPPVPPGKTRADVNAGIKAVLDRINQQYPGMYYVFNQGWSFANAFPQYVSGMQTESMINNGSWGQNQVSQAQALRSQYNIPTFMTQYADPYSSQARNYYDQIIAWGGVPYIVGTGSDGHHWTSPGLGYNIQPGW